MFACPTALRLKFAFNYSNLGAVIFGVTFPAYPLEKTFRVEFRLAYPMPKNRKKTCKRFKCFTEKYRKHKGWFRNPGFTHLPCVKPYGKLANLPTGFLPSTRECLKKTNPAEASILACWKSFETSDSWIWLKSIFSTSKLLHQNHTSLPTLESLFCHFESICLKPLINSIWVITFMDKFKKKTLSATNPQFPPYLVPPDASQKSAKLTDPWPAPGCCYHQRIARLETGCCCNYCWWKKSCTDVRNLVNNGINYQP